MPCGLTDPNVALLLGCIAYAFSCIISIPALQSSLLCSRTDGFKTIALVRHFDGIKRRYLLMLLSIGSSMTFARATRDGNVVEVLDLGTT